MGRLTLFVRHIGIICSRFNIFLVIAFFSLGLLYASICDVTESAISVVANTVCGAIVFLIATNCLREPRDDKSMRQFSMLAWTTFCFIIADLLGWITLAEQAIALLQYFVDAAEVLVGYLITMTFTHYLCEFMKASYHWTRLFCRVLDCLCILFALAFLITLPMGLPFSIINRVYVRGPLFVLFQIYPFIILLGNLFLIVFNNKLTIYQREVLSAYCLVPMIAMSIQVMYYGIAATSVALTISLIIVYDTIYLECFQTLAQQEQELTMNRVNMMVSQIQPHFLYNTLTSIANLCEKEPKTARQAITDFSDYLRVNLDSLKCNQTVPFEKELEHCKIYLSFEKMRFEEELNVEFDIQTSNFRIPILSVQPLLENAVKHGICNKPGGGTVRLSTYRGEGRICVEISDDGIGFDPSAVPNNDSRQHIGLENVRYRVRQMCKGEIIIESTPGAGTKVTISLPEKDGDTA